MDPFYKGYPTGYLIISKSLDFKLKGGSLFVGKKIMIDDQQRVGDIYLGIEGISFCNEHRVLLSKKINIRRKK